MSVLKGQIAVVTGAANGIGKAVALNLSYEEVRLCVVDRDLNGLHAVANSTERASENISIYKADLGIDDDIYRLVDNLRREFERIDILIHSAGVISIAKIEQASIEDFDHQYRINVRAPYLLTQGLLPMLKLRSGQVLFINSSAGLTAKAGVAQYSATKHALKAVADSLRDEVNADGIRVISVYPGRTATPMQAIVHAAENRVYRPEGLMQPEDVASVVINALSLPRTAEVTDINIRPLKKT